MSEKVRAASFFWTMFLPTPNMTQSNNPLHGITLKVILETLVEYYGWEKLGKHVKINCFITNPSLNSSLTFLRKTPWARKKIEDLYLEVIERKLN